MVLYNTAISFYFFALRIASLFNHKAQLLINGQKNWKTNFESAIKTFNGASVIWVHCASVGEFEQGRPLIEGLRSNYPKHKILLTFFSPSGYELHKNYNLADLVMYLPFDSKSNARHFINCSNLKTVIFVKYEFWLHYLWELNSKKIPTYLVSAIIREHQPFFKWYGKAFVKALHNYKTIFVQDENSLLLLKKLNAVNGMTCGDTRIDRVLSIRTKALELDRVKEFSGSCKIIIAGSTWPEDEALLLNAFVHLKEKHKDLKLIIVPHEVNEKNIVHLEKEIESQKNKINYSLYTSSGSCEGSDLLIVNTVGLLSSLYRYGHMAYVGGGFGNGIHNILEPAVFGSPMIFGPNHQKFNEAQDLLKLGAATEITDGSGLLNAFSKFLDNPPILQDSSQTCLNYVNANQGASEKILKQITINYSADL